MTWLPPPTGHPLDEALRAALVALVLAIVFAVAEAWRHRASPDVEWTRKFIHSAVGLVTMTFPWVFARTGTLVLLGLACGAVLLAARNTGRLGSVLIAAQLALLVTSFEAISGRGTDNLIVPLATYYLLVKLTGNTTEGIALQLGAQLVILALALLIAWRTRFLSLSGAVAAHLVLYASFSLGGPSWIVAPLLALVAYLSLDAAHRRATRPSHRLPRHVTAIFYVAIVATACLFADNTLVELAKGSPARPTGSPLFALFVGALAAPLATAGAWTAGVLPQTRAWTPLARAVVPAFLAWLVVVPAGIAAVRGMVVAEEAAIAGLVVAASLLLYALGFRLFRPERRGHDDLRVLAAAVLVAVLLALPLHLALFSPGSAG